MKTPHMPPVDREVSRRNIDLLTGVAMAGGAVLSVSVAISEKLHSPATSSGGMTTVWYWEILLFAVLGAAPGWLLKGILNRRFHPETHGERFTEQARCKECGAVLSQRGEACSDCRR